MAAKAKRRVADSGVPLSYTRRAPVATYYPRLQRNKTVKRPSVEKPSLTTNPVKFHRRIWSVRTITATGASDYFSKVDLWQDSGISASRTFQRNKDWKQLVAKGQSATYPYSRTGGFVKPIQYNGISYGGGQTSLSDGSVIGSVSTGGILNNADLVNTATARIKSRLNGHIGHAQLAAPLAESREIHRLVRQINGLGLDAVKAMLALRKTRGKSAFKFAGDVWLGFNFGAKPLIKDIESAANAILDYTTREDKSVRVSGTASRDWASSLLSNIGQIAEGILMDVYSSYTHKQSVRIVAGVDLKLRSAASYSVTDHLGLEFSALPSTLWELTPYSWMVDYFITVGPWLEDMFYTLPGVAKYVSQSAKYQNEQVMAPKLNYSSTYRSRIVMTPGSAKYYTFARTVLSALPYRQIQIKSLDQVATDSLSKLLNLASVLASHAGPRLR